MELKRANAFFPALLGIQGKLLKAGFKVPNDRETGRKSSIPIVSSSSEGRRIKKGRLRYIKLGLKKRKETKAGLKVGIVWENGKPVEITLKLSTTDPRIRIQGLYGELIANQGENSPKPRNGALCPIPVIFTGRSQKWALPSAVN